MSWLSDFLSALKPSSREEHFWAKIAGEEELENEYIPSAREEGFLYKIAEKIQGMIPAVGTNDKGKYLKTNDSTGALEWAEGGGGGGAFVVNVTLTSATAGTADKSASEIHAAAEVGNIVMCRVEQGSVSMFGYLVVDIFVAEGNENNAVVFMSDNGDGTTIISVAEDKSAGLGG